MQLLATYAHTTWAAVLVATHDERALDLADRVIAIEDGQHLTRPGGWPAVGVRW
jgi:ABC-type lipoprotein export system ATPase subunit